MEARVKLALAVFIMALAVFSVAGVLAYKYLKVANYVCYYGAYAPGSYDAVVTTGPTGSPAPGQFFVNGSWVRTDDLHCVELSSTEEFSCPSGYGGESKFLGYQYATKGSIERFVDKT